MRFKLIDLNDIPSNDILGSSPITDTEIKSELDKWIHEEGMQYSQNIISMVEFEDHSEWIDKAGNILCIDIRRGVTYKAIAYIEVINEGKVHWGEKTHQTTLSPLEGQYRDLIVDKIMDNSSKYLETIQIDGVEQSVTNPLTIEMDQEIFRKMLREHVDSTSIEEVKETLVKYMLRDIVDGKGFMSTID
jgi:hypothetical protein